MDIRSFFQQGAAAKRKPAAAAAPAKEEPGRRTAKKQSVVVLDDSDEEEEVVPVKKPAPRRRLRRADDSDEDFDDNETKPVVKCEHKSSEMSVKREQKSSEMAVKRETARSSAAAVSKSKPALSKAIKTEVKAEPVRVKDDDMTTPMAPASAGKPPPVCLGCLDGKTFAFSGQFPNLSREDAIHLVKSCGGSVSKSITRATNYLVVGSSLENGDDVDSSVKYKDAVAKNVRILQQNAFYNLISEASSNKQLEELQKEKAELKRSLQSGSGTAKGKQKLGTALQQDNVLWTDKYKPKRLEDVIGNIELGKRLKQWLADWHDIHVTGTKKVPFTTKLSENRGAKTVLLSGPPGIGKTTLATLVADISGFTCTELNASDTRSKKMLQTGLSDVLGTQALQFGNSKSNMKLARRVVIMDEVDGMSGGDRGGMAELILLIKKSKTPIICICNDRQSQKVRSLANHSYDLRLRRPTKVQIANRLMQIGLQEGLTVEKNALEEAAERCGGDIRQLLTQMQRWRLTKTKVTYADLVNPSAQHQKDETLRLNIFSATQQIFQREATFDMRTEAFFVDYDFMPLMVQENYIQSIMNQRHSSDESLATAAKAADFIAESDLVSKLVRSEQRWDLLTKQSALNVAACCYSAGFIGHPEFSRWLGKNSTAGKSKRLLSELSVRMRAHASGSREVIRLDYVPFMKEILLQKLLSGEEHVEEVIELLDACEIAREDLTESMESFKFPGVKRHSYGELDTKAKTSFTRQYNKASHKAQGVVENVLGSTTIKKGRGKAAAQPEDDDAGLGVASDAESEPENNEEDDVSMFQKKPRGRAAAGGAATKRKSATSAAKKAPAKKRRAAA